MGRKLLTKIAIGTVAVAGLIGAGIGVANAANSASEPGPNSYMGGGGMMGGTSMMSGFTQNDMDAMHDRMLAQMPAQYRQQCDQLHDEMRSNATHAAHHATN